jgi:hypothetical protein
MATVVTCPCGAEYVLHTGTFPRPVSCHACGARAILNGPAEFRDAAGWRAQERPDGDSPAQSRTCPDCGGELEAVTLFGRGPENPLSGAAIDAAVLHYADPDGKRGWAFGMLTPKGRVQSLLCTSCRRIFLYGR